MEAATYLQHLLLPWFGVNRNNCGLLRVLQKGVESAFGSLTRLRDIDK